MIGPGDWDKRFGLISQLKEFLAMPRSNHLVCIAMDNQHGTMDLANIFVIRKLVKGQEWNAREDTKSGDERTLQDEPCRRFSSGKMDCRSATDRPPINDD